MRSAGADAERGRVLISWDESVDTEVELLEVVERDQGLRSMSLRVVPDTKLLKAGPTTARAIVVNDQGHVVAAGKWLVSRCDESEAVLLSNGSCLPKDNL